jgi:hypothetical protein
MKTRCVQWAGRTALRAEGEGWHRGERSWSKCAVKKEVEASAQWRNRNCQAVKYNNNLFFVISVRRKRENRFLTSSCLSVFPHVSARLLLGDFPNIWYWRLLRKSAEKLQIWLKSDNNIEHFTWRHKYVYIVDSSTKHVVARREYRGNQLLHFHGNTHFIISKLHVGQ